MPTPLDDLRYNDTPIRGLLNERVPETTSGDDEFFLYVMGPYTAFDLEYARNLSNDDSNDSDTESRTEYIDDPLFDSNTHAAASKGTYEAALSDLCERIREEVGARAYIATDVDIPTPSESKSPSSGLTPLSQSLYFAAVSEAVMFIYSQAALNAGVATEMGAILSEFNLRPKDIESRSKSPDRFRFYHTPYFSSETVEGMPMDFLIDHKEFSSEQQLVNDIDDFTHAVHSMPDRYYPIWDGPTEF